MPDSVLPNLVPSAFVDERRGQGVDARAVGPTDQLDAGGDVAPLVAAAGLQDAAVAAVQLEVVERLQQHVAELGVADAGLEPAADDVAGQHPVDREVLADVAEEVERAERLGPVEVVDDRGRVVAVEVDEAGDLVADAARPTPPPSPWCS